jgi:hypothetical protein
MSASDKYKRSQRTAAGADKWLDMRLWDDTTQCLTGLKAAGYQVVVTSLTQHSVTIQVSRVRGTEGVRTNLSHAAQWGDNKQEGSLTDRCVATPRS